MITIHSNRSHNWSLTSNAAKAAMAIIIPDCMKILLSIRVSSRAPKKVPAVLDMKYRLVPRPASFNDKPVCAISNLGIWVLRPTSIPTTARIPIKSHKWSCLRTRPVQNGNWWLFWHFGDDLCQSTEAARFLPAECSCVDNKNQFPVPQYEAAIPAITGPRNEDMALTNCPKVRMLAIFFRLQPEQSSDSAKPGEWCFRCPTVQMSAR